jgi:hypothetical protein
MASSIRGPVMVVFTTSSRAIIISAPILFCKKKKKNNKKGKRSIRWSTEKLRNGLNDIKQLGT